MPNGTWEITFKGKDAEPTEWRFIVTDGEDHKRKPQDIQIGLREDGVVVWRKSP